MPRILRFPKTGILPERIPQADFPVSQAGFDLVIDAVPLLVHMIDMRGQRTALHLQADQVVKRRGGDPDIGIHPKAARIFGQHLMGLQFGITRADQRIRMPERDGPDFPHPDPFLAEMQT